DASLRLSLPLSVQAGPVVPEALATARPPFWLAAPVSDRALAERDDWDSWPGSGARVEARPARVLVDGCEPWPPYYRDPGERFGTLVLYDPGLPRFNRSRTAEAFQIAEQAFDPASGVVTVVAHRPGHAWLRLDLRLEPRQGSDAKANQAGGLRLLRSPLEGDRLEAFGPQDFDRLDLAVQRTEGGTVEAMAIRGRGLRGDGRTIEVQLNLRPN
ncbi:MAG: hypothetical protein AAFZ65_05230, partial [Planctomycetota bacterium]